MISRAAVLSLLLCWSVVVQAGAREDALEAYGKFFTSFTAGNDEQIASLFAPDAQFYGTSSSEIVTSPDGVRAYFKRALSGPSVVLARPLSNTALVLSDNVVVISGKWQSERTLDGKTVINGPNRNSVVMHKRGDRWLIVQFHNSPTPKPPPAAPAAAPAR